MGEVNTQAAGERSGVVATVDGLVGRELDAEVAERVMEWPNLTIKRFPHEDGSEGTMTVYGNKPDCMPWPRFWELGQATSGRNEKRHIPRYSASIAAAMEIVEKVAAPSIHFMCDYLVQRNGEKRWFAQFLRDGPTDGSHNEWVEAPTLPEAICRAALQVRGARLTLENLHANTNQKHSIK